ncbi:MAG TPA: pilus assembly protein [Bryobacteraceae bacterium]|nr:hypothetical protein [Bryobacterales bacterium]HRJ19335.1 pilus assembly protein [Bryobacteraceae bacterium]
MKAKRARGQQLVEFALIVTVVLIFLFGIIDVGIAFLSHETIAQRAAWAARYYSTTNDAAGAESIVRSGSAGGGGYVPIGMAGASVVIRPFSSVDAGSFSGVAVMSRHVEVRVTNYRYPMFTPVVGRIIAAAPITACHPVEE